MLKRQKGFTLIELLVVIAIIGLLSSVVLVSMSGSRDSAKDAAIQSDLGQVRSLAEMIQIEDSSYADLCDTVATLGVSHTTYGAELTTIQTDIGTQQGTLDLVCASDSSDYCIVATLNNGEYFCIDSNGSAGSHVSVGCSAIAPLDYICATD